MASDAHGEVLRCARRDTALTPSITADRTAGGGAPITATYAVTRAIVVIDAARGGSRAARHSSSTASAMIAT
jgi:hypothetical protein